MPEWGRVVLVRGGFGRLPVWAVVAGLLLAVPVAVAGAPAASAAIPTSGCGDLLFLGARGSGQPQEGSSGDGWTGLGPQVYSVSTSLIARVVNPRAVVRMAVQFPAYPVPKTLRPSSIQNYFTGLDQGVTEAWSQLTTRIASCPNERIVLAGYSQGAMVMHRVVIKLHEAGYTGILDRLAGVVLVADGDRIPRDNYTRYGSAGERYGGIGLSYPAISGAKRTEFPASLKSKVHSVCNAGDLVCDYNGSKEQTAYGGAVHTKYTNTAPLRDAAAAVARSVLMWPVAAPKAQTVAATVGQPVSRQLTADPPGVSYQWRIPAGAALPAGLSMSAGGLITGTPAAAGSATVPVEVRRNTAGMYGAWIQGATVTVNPTVGPPGGGTWRQISAGDAHSCGVTTAGAAYCWGRNDDGQVGNGTITDWPVLAPVLVEGLGSGVASISASIVHSCAVTTAGVVYCWGYNGYGSLGDGTTSRSPVPVPVAGLGSGVASISAGGYHSCAVTTDGAAYCWGFNLFGQLGNGTANDVPALAGPVAGLGSGVASISSGRYHSCAVTTAGAALCWGSNDYGALGDGTAAQSPVPVPVVGLGSGVASISAGAALSCAVTTAGSAHCWGLNTTGQLGDGTFGFWSLVPVPVSGLGSGVASISAGVEHSCAVTTAGSAYCWGDDSDGELGTDTTNLLSPVPVQVSGLGSGTASMSANYIHSCAVTTAGAAYCWGWNGLGGLGDGTTTNSSVPVAVTGP